MSRIIFWFLAAVSILGAFVVVINVTIFGDTVGYIHTSISRVPEVPVALVLGSSVTNSKLMPVALDRANTAIELYDAGKVKLILVSGDNGTRSYNEVIPVKKYLVSQGVPEEKIFLDYAGFDTYDSLYRAKEIFGVTNLVIVTQAFHLPRAVYIARSLGLTAFGMSADKREYLLKNSVREWFANIKALYQIDTGAQATVLGERIQLPL
ncbi:MAG: ElyC/SanA/YdcF family protein [Candidatus Paceibacterota bacterium]|jgi:SanA protein